MSVIYTDIRAALEKELQDAALAPIAFENVSYSPTTGTSFLKPIFIPTIRRPAVMGTTPQQRYQGIFRVLCHAKEGAGPGAADSLANSVMEAFEATTDISYTNASDATITVSIDYADRGLGLLDAPWYIVPVTIGWYIYN